MRKTSAKRSGRARRQKVLCYVNHYFGTTSAFVGKSTAGNAQERQKIIQEVVSRLRALPGEIDIRICGFPQSALVPVDIDLSSIGEPRWIVYESIERMFAHLDDYDWFLNIEDDIFISEDLLANVRAFAASSKINEVWLPNRMEQRDDGTMSCIDLAVTPGWTGLERHFRGETLGVALNCHSGLFLLSRAQLRYASTRVPLKQRVEFHGGLMASAYANVHAPFLLWRAKSAPLAHHVIHADRWMYSAEACGTQQSEPGSCEETIAGREADPGLRAEIIRKDTDLTVLQDEIGRLVAQVSDLSATHKTLLRSTSWRLTAPLRNFGNALPWLRTPLRRAAWLAWWTVTLQAPRRLAERRAATAAGVQAVKPPALQEAVSPASTSIPQKPPAFDRDWYLNAYPDVAAARVDPFEHYTTCGKWEGRHPTSEVAEEAIGFDRVWYLTAYPDVTASGQDPFRHWLDHGKAEGRHFNAQFSFSPRQLTVLARSYHYKGYKTTSLLEPTPSGPFPARSTPTFDSHYWRDGHPAGGNLGAGSYGRLADFINTFVREHDVASVIEFGCGDGTQLLLADYPTYLGFDAADERIELCRSKFGDDATKAFRNAATWDYETADLTLSLDVIFHLIEDDVFHEYMRRLFASAERYVMVYSSSHDGDHLAGHVKHRQFTDWIDVYHPDFKLIPPVQKRRTQVADDQIGPFADFFIFEKQPSRRHTLPGHLIVSLTSYAPRFPTLELTLRCILQQTVKPDETVLWITSEDWEQLPAGVLALQRGGLTIRETRNLRSYKKIVPALEHYPDSFIITLDDDLAYPLDTIEPLVVHYQDPTEILCRRAHKVTYDAAGKPLSYDDWQFETPDVSGSDLFPTGGAGVLYPPRALAPEVLDEPIFTTLAPTADDVWLFWMGRLAGRTVRRVGPRYALRPWPGCHEQGLWVNHNANRGNDRAIAALTAHYGSPIEQS